MSDYVIATYVWAAVAAAGIAAPMLALVAQEASKMLGHKLSL